MINRIALFIDGGYLDKINEFYKIKLDYNKLSQSMANKIPLLRAYYYHCLPYQSSKPSEEERTRFSKAQSYFRKLNSLEQFTLYYSEEKFWRAHLDFVS